MMYSISNKVTISAMKRGPYKRGVLSEGSIQQYMYYTISVYVKFGLLQEWHYKRGTTMQQQTRGSVGGVCVIHLSFCSEETFYRTFYRCFQPNFGSFSYSVSEEKIFQKSINQKQELPVVAMFINGSELNEHSFQRTFQGCFLPNFSSFGQRFNRRRFFRNQPIRNKKCLWRPCL